MHHAAAEQIRLPGPHAAPKAVPQADALLREAEAQRALAELFPHLKLDALRAIQDLFPLHAQARAQAAAQTH
jgi:hypothetical protein